METKNMQISEWNWKSFDGLDMYTRVCLPDAKPKAIMVLVHGLGEHVARYDHVAAALTDKGYALLGFDLRGHGRSGGPRGHSPCNEALMKDIDSMLKEVEARYPGVRQFLYGHSLGGTLVLHYILCRKPALAGAVTTAPALRSPVLEQKLKVTFARLLGSLMPSVTIPSGLDVSGLSHNPEVIDRYQRDPLVHDRGSLGLGKGQVDMIPWIFEHAGELNIPLLVMHGTGDRIAFSRGSKELAQRTDGKMTLKLWDGLYHELHNEPEQEQVFAYMLDWLEKH
jgi:alpha-beta hydrolase superfamily lysophospholipase